MQGSHKQVEATLKEMVEQKNKLAYEKGKLQAQVDSYQHELESLAGAQTELTQYKRITTSLEAKLSKVRKLFHTRNAL